MSDGGNGVTSSAIGLRVKVVAMFDRTHNPFDETHWVSCLRENLTSSSDGEGLETGLRSTLNGHEGGNLGYSQGQSYELPRQSFTRQKDISQQIEFFHLNRVSSSMVIKVDFDLTMSVLANNLLRLFAADLPGYSHLNPESLYTKFLHNSGHVKITDEQIVIALRKKRNLPALLSAAELFHNQPSRLFHGRKLTITGDSRS